MRYFVDTEFVYTSGTCGAWLYPLSIGVVAEDGREFYRVSHGALHNTRVTRSFPQFVRQHVIPVLFQSGFGDDYIVPLDLIAVDLREFIGDDTPEFWGDYSGFDYVALTTIMGGMEAWPEGWPMHINDLRQDAIPSVESKQPHNALADARAVRDAWNWAFQVDPNDVYDPEP